MDEDTLCASVDGDKESFDTADIGIQALKRCWYKLKKKDDAPKKVKELVGEVLSKKEIESLENWEKKENTREDVTEKRKEATEMCRYGCKHAGESFGMITISICTVFACQEGSVTTHLTFTEEVNI